MARQHHTPLIVEDITHFLKEHKETKIRSTVTGSSDFQWELPQETPRRVSIPPRHRRRHRLEAHVMSITSGETRRSSIFDSVESSSSASSALPGYVFAAYSCILP